MHVACVQANCAVLPERCTAAALRAGLLPRDTFGKRRIARHVLEIIACNNHISIEIYHLGCMESWSATGAKELVCVVFLDRSLI